jgi:nitrogen regulatory protein PII
MKLVVFVLNKEELLERVLEAYVEAGVDGATILDSEGMGRFLTYEVPLFADFKQFMKGNKPYNKTILSVVDDPAVVPRLYSILDEVTGGLATPGTGIFFTVPVDFAAGLVGMGEVAPPGTGAPSPPSQDGTNTDQGERS